MQTPHRKKIRFMHGCGRRRWTCPEEEASTQHVKRRDDKSADHGRRRGGREIPRPRNGNRKRMGGLAAARPSPKNGARQVAGVLGPEGIDSVQITREKVPPRFGKKRRRPRSNIYSAQSNGMAGGPTAYVAC